MPKLYKVGGCVRDKLLGVKTKDIDFVFVLDNLDKTVEEGFQEMKSWMENEGFTIFLSVPEMFTIRAKFPSDHKFAKLDADFVMARKEVGYEEGTRRPILELGDLTDDLIRRDFTINALAETEDGLIVDLFNGRGDLEKGILRTPLDPMVTFMDDPLRLLRALRFTVTKDFTMHIDVWEAMKQPNILAKLTQTVSSERIREEVLKMMAVDTPRTIRLLLDVDNEVPGFLEIVFKEGLWLKPTFEKR
jgi:tRNA nucleotidyltransferase/poly(A) polymerase